MEESMYRSCINHIEMEESMYKSQSKTTQVVTSERSLFLGF